MTKADEIRQFIVFYPPMGENEEKDALAKYIKLVAKLFKVDTSYVRRIIKDFRELAHENETTIRTIVEYTKEWNLAKDFCRECFIAGITGDYDLDYKRIRPIAKTMGIYSYSMEAAYMLIIDTVREDQLDLANVCEFFQKQAQSTIGGQDSPSVVN